MSKKIIDLDKQQIARQFSRAAASYDSVSQLQLAMAARLVEMISWGEEEEKRLLIDLGCGTGAGIERILTGSHWQTSLPNAGKDHSDGSRKNEQDRRKLSVIGVDLAPGMIQQAQARLIDFPNVQFIVGDMESTQLPGNQADYLYSCASLQWCDSQAVFQEAHRLLKPGGQVVIATFGPATMHQLRTAYQSIGEKIIPVHSFESLDRLTANLTAVGLQLVQQSCEITNLHYDTPLQMLHSIKSLGATHARDVRRTGLGGRSRLDQLCHHIRQQMSRPEQIELTFEILYLSGRKLQ